MLNKRLKNQEFTIFVLGFNIPKHIKTKRMISKAKLKYINALQTKKGRLAHGTFVAEGPKVVHDLLSSFQPELIVATEQWLERHEDEILKGNQGDRRPQIFPVSPDELQKISLLQHPQEVLAVFEQRHMPAHIAPTHELVLALDGIQDPGNLGTIIRIADWFGIRNVICSEDTADVYNPKVVQATMGSIAHVDVTYLNLCEFVDALPPSTPVYGTLLDGEDIYQQTLTATGIIIMGNEGNGISKDLRARVNHPLLIPNFSTLPNKAESLNVAIATAIACSEFKRRTITT